MASFCVTEPYYTREYLSSVLALAYSLIGNRCIAPRCFTHAPLVNSLRNFTAGWPRVTTTDYLSKNTQSNTRFN